MTQNAQEIQRVVLLRWQTWSVVRITPSHDSGRIAGINVKVGCQELISNAAMVVHLEWRDCYHRHVLSTFDRRDHMAS